MPNALADSSQSDNSQRLAVEFDTGRSQPPAFLYALVTGHDVPGKGQERCERQISDRVVNGAGCRRDYDAAFARRIQIDVICADAVLGNGFEMHGAADDIRCQFVGAGDDCIDSLQRCHQLGGPIRPSNAVGDHLAPSVLQPRDMFWKTLAKRAGANQHPPSRHAIVLSG